MPTIGTRVVTPTSRDGKKVKARLLDDLGKSLYELVCPYDYSVKDAEQLAASRLASALFYVGGVHPVGGPPVRGYKLWRVIN